MRTLIFSQYFWPENFQINEVTEQLEKKGCNLVVLTGQPNYPEGKIFQGYHRFGLQSEDYQSVLIKRVPLWPRGNSKIGLILNYLSFIISASIFGPFRLRHKNFDVIFVYAISPLLAALPALLIGWIKSAPVVIWVQDLWPESLSATGYVKNKFILKLIEKVVQFIYQRADLLLVQSEAFIEEVKPLAGNTPVIYYPNSVDPSFTQPVDRRNSPLPELDDKFVILFAGNIGTAQAIETIINAASLLRENDQLHFVLVGDGSMRNWALEEVKSRNLNNVTLPGKFPQEQMPAFMAQASALLVSLKDQEIFAKTVPNKMQAYLAVGRPIIASLNGEGARVVEAAKAGLAVRAEDSVALAQTCYDLFNICPQERAKMGKRGREYFFNHYNNETLINDLIKHFKNCSIKERKE